MGVCEPACRGLTFGHGEVVAGLVKELNPEFVFFPHTYQGRDFAPRVAARFGRSLISDLKPGAYFS